MQKKVIKNPFLDNASYYNKTYGFNILPVKITSEGKKPALSKWSHLQEGVQSKEDIIKIKWSSDINGIALINGQIHSLDFDRCSNKNFVLQIADELRINSWIVKTGFGYHLHFIIEDPELIKLELGNKGTYFFDSNNKSILDHCELRVGKCYTTLPPSQHYNGSNYTFISGLPKDRPQKVSAQKILDVLQKYFIIKKAKQLREEPNTSKAILEYLNSGVNEGKRHKALVQIFGVFFNQGLSKDFILAAIKNWNLKNQPPIDEQEIEKQTNDLWQRYSKGFDGVFLQFQNCLMQLKDDYKTKLFKIICYSILEFNGDDKIIKELGLDNIKKDYHKECKNLVERYESRTKKKDQIVRIGQRLILDVLNSKFKFVRFSIYVGIVSYLGRNFQKPAKRISHNIIGYRAIGYKNFEDFLEADTPPAPPTKNIIRAAIKWLEEAGFIITFSIKKGQMRYFSTQLKTKESLADWVIKGQTKKMDKKINEEKIRQRVLDAITEKEKEYRELLKKKPSNQPSLHFE